MSSTPRISSGSAPQNPMPEAGGQRTTRAATNVPAAISPNWVNIGHVIDAAVWDAANRAKDRDDERLDAMRVHNGMTLDEFLAKQ